jgi:hypothetical protein
VLRDGIGSDALARELEFAAPLPRSDRGKIDS